ncbi:MAG: hypothetical protein S4CHLAM7_11800 [Chlamydiae bacterium]|nr:hypothetical protein [Chlamydiota bacterium]
MFKHRDIEIYWLKHAGFKIKNKDGVLYIDPFQLTREQEKADVIILSHTHADHLDPVSLQAISKKETTIFCSQDAPEKLAEMVQVDAVMAMHPDEEKIFGHLKIHTYPAYNLDKPFHPKESGWLGFVIEMEGTRIYFSGDTDSLEELEKVQCDIALLPVSGIYVMTADQAAAFANKIKPKVVSIPMHWGTLIDDQNRKVGTLEDAQKFCDLCEGPSQILPTNA